MEKKHRIHNYYQELIVVVEYQFYLMTVNLICYIFYVRISTLATTPTIKR